MCECRPSSGHDFTAALSSRLRIQGLSPTYGMQRQRLHLLTFGRTLHGLYKALDRRRRWAQGRVGSNDAGRPVAARFHHDRHPPRICRLIVRRAPAAAVAWVIQIFHPSARARAPPSSCPFSGCQRRDPARSTSTRRRSHEASATGSSFVFFNHQIDDCDYDGQIRLSASNPGR